MSDAARAVIGGRYQIIATLGQGGMGLVYKAYDPVLDRVVALKKMVATVVDSDERRTRFYIEARAAARLNHPNIVTIYELEEHAGDVYIVMELLEGVSLAAFMQQRVPLSLAGYLSILAQVAEGLHYAHERAIVHRDIKPANLVLTTGGGVKILDFGIAQLASQAITKAGAMLGTPHYMAPEQIKDEPVDARADLFSLGAVAYELVTGVKPFMADSIAALLMRITSTPHTPVREAAPDTPPALAEIIDGLLAKDRTQRPATGAALCQALERIGEIDRVDLVAEAVRAVMGPTADQAVFAPTTPANVTPANVMPPPLSTPSTDPSAPTVLVSPDAPHPPAVQAPTQALTPSPRLPAPSPVSPVPASPSSAAPLLSTDEASDKHARATVAVPRVPGVDAGVPQAKTRRGSGAALIAIVAVLMLGFAGAGWWAYTSAGALWTRVAPTTPPTVTPPTTTARSTAPDAASPTPPSSSLHGGGGAAGVTPTVSTSAGTASSPASDVPSSPPATARAEPASAGAAAESVRPDVFGAKPADTTAHEPTSNLAPVAPPARSLAASDTSRTASSRGASRGAGRETAADSGSRGLPRGSGRAPDERDASRPASHETSSATSVASPEAARKTESPEVARAAASRDVTPEASPRNAGRETGSRDATSEASPRELPREPGREPAARESEPAAAAARPPLDPSSVAAFQSSTRSGSASGAFHANAPSTAASIARITYTLQAYSDAIEARDLEALRDVRSPVTSTETAWVKDGTTTVRFTNLDVRIDGTEAIVRCHRTIVTDGKTRASGPVEVRLTRRPAGWIITDIH